MMSVVIRDAMLKMYRLVFLSAFYLVFSQNLFASTPVLEYRMDECFWNGSSGSVKDSSGNAYHATPKSANTTTTPQVSAQIINNGTLLTRANQQYIELPTLAINTPNFQDSFTVTSWAKFSSAGSWERIFDFGNGTDVNNIFLGRNWTTNDLILGIHDPGTTQYLTATNAISDTNWHFWAVSCSGSTCKLYKDGSEIASSSTMKIPANVARTKNYIGKSNWNDAYFEGGVDEFKVFDENLSAAQILAIYNNELAKKNYDGSSRYLGCTLNPIAEYRFDECDWMGVSGEVKDSSGNNRHGTVLSGANIFQNSKIKNGGDFNTSSTDAIDIGKPDLNLTNQMTVMAWINWQVVPSTGAQWANIVSFNSSSTVDKHPFVLQHDKTNNKFEFAVTTATRKVVTSTATTQYNTWQHVVGVYDGSKLIIYVDGIPSTSTVTQSGTISQPLADAKLQIGQSANITSPRNFSGYLDEIKILDYALSASEIASLYGNENTGKNYNGITRESTCNSYCQAHSLSNGFHIIDPFHDINKSIEVFCYENKDYIALPIKNDANNFVFNNTLSTTHYYNEAKNNANHFDAIEINGYTLEVKTDANQSTPQTVNDFKVMGSSFSNINLTATPFAIDWSKSTISDCNTSKLRKAYYGQDVKINTLDYDNKAICKIDKMQLKLLDDYRYLYYQGKEVLKSTCKSIPLAIPSTVLNASDIKGHYWISPFSYQRSYEATNIKADGRPIVAYCWYQTDINQAWTFLLAMDGKATKSKNDLVSKIDTCSEFGLIPFVPESERTFERVREFLYDKKSEWTKYTGTINEKTKMFLGANYYLEKERESLIWPYGSFGVYFPSAGNTPKAWGSGSQSVHGWMSGAPMHNIKTITSDYARLDNDEAIETRDYYSLGKYSNTDSPNTDGNYTYNETMGAKGWKSVLSDLNKTDEWFISRTGAGPNIDRTNTYQPYYEPNGNYTANAWLNFLYDSNGRVRHNDDLDDKYAYYDYMCMAETNIDAIVRYERDLGRFDVIERSVTTGTELANRFIKTKVLNAPILLDVIVLNNDMDKLGDYNLSVGIFLNEIETAGSVETPKDIKYIGDIRLDNTGSFNSAKSSGRFSLQDLSTWSEAKKAARKMIFSFKYCNGDTDEWTSCWNLSGNSATCKPGKEAVCMSVVNSDFFAIRPKNFILSTAGDIFAGENFTINFKANDALATPSTSYSETKDSSFRVTSAIQKSSPCVEGNFSLESFSFENGQKSIDANYSEVGDVNITIEEKLGSEFALIDASDTSSELRLIEKNSTKITVKPYDINVTQATFTASTGKNWLYDANVSDMNVTAFAEVKAYQKNGTAPLVNFSNGCYAQDVGLVFDYTTSPSNANVNLSYVPYDANKSISLIDKSIIIPATAFSNGVGNTRYAFNIDRTYNQPLNPINITLNDVNVSSNISKNKHHAVDLNQSKTFYYGRVKTKDIATNKTNLGHNLHVEVYATTPNAYVSGFYQETLNWYINSLDDNVTTINDINLTAYKDFTKTTPISLVSATNKSGLNDGKMDFNLTKGSSSEKQATFHLNIPTWLWYSTLGTKDYNASSTSNCAQHPCFEYRFIESDTNVGIKSGEFKGSTIGSSKDFNATYQKTGVKTFR